MYVSNSFNRAVQGLKFHTTFYRGSIKQNYLPIWCVGSKNRVSSKFKGLLFYTLVLFISYQWPWASKGQRDHRASAQDKGTDEEVPPEIKINVSISSKCALGLNRLCRVNHGGFDCSGAEPFWKSARWNVPWLSGGSCLVPCRNCALIYTLSNTTLTTSAAIKCHQ